MSVQTDMVGATAPDVAAQIGRSALRQNEQQTISKAARRAGRSAPSLLDLHEFAVLERLIDKATRGDMSAMCLFFELQRRDRCVTLDIPKIETTENALAANALVIAAVVGGQLTPAEGAHLGSLVSLQLKLPEGFQQDKRIKALEEKEVQP